MDQHNQPNQRDAAIDKTLAALHNASPPAGMEARITQRLQHRAGAQPASFHWRNLLAGSSLSGTWWRGALAGAATAMLAITGVLLLQHHLLTPPSQVAQNGSAAVHSLAPVAVLAANPPPAAQAIGSPCASPKVLRVHSIDSPHAETPTPIHAPSRPAPIRPLTAQEQALAQLARNADPKLLVALSPETQARVDAQEQENFSKFFAPPPPPPQPVDSEPATKPNPNQSQL